MPVERDCTPRFEPRLPIGDWMDLASVQPEGLVENRLGDLGRVETHLLQAPRQASLPRRHETVETNSPPGAPTFSSTC